MRYQIALTALSLALISSSVLSNTGLAKESMSDTVSIYKALAKHSLFISTEPVSHYTPLVFQTEIIAEDTATETLNILHNTVKADLNAKIEATMNRSLQASLR